MTKIEAVTKVVKEHFPNIKSYEDKIQIEYIIQRAHYYWSRNNSPARMMFIAAILKEAKTYSEYNRNKFTKLIPRNLLFELCEEVEELYDGDSTSRFNRPGVATLSNRRQEFNNQEARRPEYLINKERVKPLL